MTLISFKKRLSLLVAIACIGPTPCQAGFWAFDDLTYAYDDMFDSSVTTSFPIDEREAVLEEGMEVDLPPSNESTF